MTVSGAPASPGIVVPTPRASRLPDGILGSGRAQGGLHEDIPLWMISSRHVMPIWNDFTDAARDLDLTNTWRAVDVGTQTIDPSVFIADAKPGGVVRLDSDPTDGDGNSLLMDQGTARGGGLLPGPNQQFVTCEWSVQPSDAVDTHWFVGVFSSVGSNPILDSNGDIFGAAAYVGFHHNADDHADGVPRFVMNTTGARIVEPLDGKTISALGSDFSDLGVRVDANGTGFKWYINGQKVAETTDGIVGGALYPGICCVMNSANARQFDADWLLVGQRR